MHATEIFQCFLSAREAARGRERERASSSGGGGGGGGGSGGLGPCSGSRGGEEEAPGSQEERRGSAGPPEGQDLYTAACNSVIHRCALLLLGVSPVLGDPSRQGLEEEQVQSAGGGAQEGLIFMTRSAQTPSIPPGLLTGGGREYIFWWNFNSLNFTLKLHSILHRHFYFYLYMLSKKYKLYNIRTT